MSNENEIQHLMRELKSAKSSYLNARLNSEDALMRHALKTDVETIEFQIDVFEKAAKADEYEAKAKAFDKYHATISSHLHLKSEPEFSSPPTEVLSDIIDIHNEYESGETDAKK